MEHALKNTDIVLSAIGGSFDGIDFTRSLGMKHIIAAMEKLGVERIMAIGGLGVMQLNEQQRLMDSPNFPPMLQAVSKEHAKAYDHLLSSKLAFTFICPPSIEQKPVTKNIDIEVEYITKQNTKSVNVGDIAFYCIEHMNDAATFRKRIAIFTQ